MSNLLQEVITGKLLTLFIHILFYCLSQSLLWNCTDDSVHLLSVLKNHDSWNASDAIFGSYAWTLICVQFNLNKPQAHKVSKTSKFEIKYYMLCEHQICTPLHTRSRIKESVLTAFSLPLYSSANSSTKGAIIRHGPHHGAQKSTSTGTSLFRTLSSQSSSVTASAIIQTIISMSMYINTSKRK